MHPTSARRGPVLDPDVEAVVGLSIVGSLAALYLTVATATIVGVALTGGGWATAGWADHGKALLTLPWHLDDPAAAYGPTPTDEMPGPVLWWTVAGCFLAGLAAVVIAVLTSLRDGRRGRGWAQRRDLRPLHAARDAVVVGTYHRRPVAVEDRHSTLVIGATQTHKTTGLAVPAILEADDLAVIALSVKDDIVSDTIGWRSTLPGHHWLFDPTNVFDTSAHTTTTTPLSGDAARRHALRARLVRSGWSPLTLTGTWQGALATAFDLTRSGASADAGADGDNKFFYDSAEAMIACYLYAAANQPGATMRTVVRWVAQRERVEVEALLARLDSDEARGHFDGIWYDDHKTLSNVFSTARLLVAAWLDPTVAASSERCDLHPASFFNGQPNTLYLVAPPSNQDRLRVVFNMIVKQFVDHAYAQVLARGRPLDRRVLIIIDELANIAPIPNLGTIASTAASQGVQLVSIVQDLSQLRSRYGADDAGTIVNNHRALLLLSGVKDIATLEMASKLLGSHEQPHRSTSRDAWGRRSRTDTTRDVALAPIEHLRQQQRGTGTLIYGNLRGAEVTLRPWFEHRQLAARARHVPANPDLINPLPADADRHDAGRDVVTAHDDWLDRDPARRAPAVDFGTTWTTSSDPDTSWRVSWNEGTGDLVAVATSGDDVQVLGHYDTEDDVSAAFPDWAQRARRPGGLDDLRRDTAHRPHSAAIYGLLLRPDGSTTALSTPVSGHSALAQLHTESIDVAPIRRTSADPEPALMWVDDNGHAKGLPVNPLATRLYGTGWPITGAAIVFRDDGRPLSPAFLACVDPDLAGPHAGVDVQTASSVADRALGLGDRAVEPAGDVELS